MRRKQSNPAFSLIELLVTLSLLLIVSSLATSYISLTHYPVRATLEKLALDFIFLQQSALTTGKKQILTLDLQTNSYAYHKRHEPFIHGVQFGTILGAQGPPSSPKQTIIEPITFEKSLVVFYPDGKMQPGALYVCDEAHYYLYALTVPVSHVSSLYKYRYQKNHWERI